jgi:hypothetical protein
MAVRQTLFHLERDLVFELCHFTCLGNRGWSGAFQIAQR